MSTASGIVTGVIGLTLLQVVVKNADRSIALIEVPANLLARWLNPYAPLIPDLREPTP